MVDLSENHRRHLLSTFRYLDEVLDQAEHILASSRSRTAFPRYVPDTAPVQRKVLADYFARFREALLAAVPDLGMVPGVAEVSILRALRAQIIAADIALEETSASSLRGYGPLSVDSAAAVERMVAELRSQLQRIDAFLTEAPDRDLQARLERLAGTIEEARLLSELERVITAHGLVELRPALAVLVERMESRRFEVALFGRVSSGKSSLLNHFLRREVLPTGVTPITAIPTRVAFASEERVTVSFADQVAQVLPLSDLAKVATEQQNPGNRKLVTHIRVELPEPRLQSGVTFVDTPGLGSLATSGSEETLAYLPRCDFGIVLVDAASSLSPQDLSVVRALYQAGAAAAVLLSKADLLTPPERNQVAEYVRRSLVSECSVDVPVAPVSVLGSSGVLADEWFEKELLPLCQKQEQMADIALRRKVGTLRDAVIATLRYRLERGQSAFSDTAPAQAKDAAQALAASAALFEPTRARCEALAFSLEAAAAPVIEAAAAATAARWQVREERVRVAREALTTSLSEHAGMVAAAIVSELTRLRERLSRALGEAKVMPSWPSDDADLPRIAGLPVLDSSALSGRLALKGSLVAVLGRGALRRTIAAQLKVQLLPLVDQALRFHRHRLIVWSRDAVSNLRRAFEAKAEVVRPRLASTHGASVPASAQELATMRGDLQVLSDWGRRNEKEG